MSEATFILLSALLLAVPVTIKYTLAFRTRKLVGELRRRERDVQRLRARVEAVEQEAVVVARAVRQVDTQRRHAGARKAMVEDRLENLLRASPRPAVAA